MTGEFVGTNCGLRGVGSDYCLSDYILRLLGIPLSSSPSQQRIKLVLLQLHLGGPDSRRNCQNSVMLAGNYGILRGTFLPYF